MVNSNTNKDPYMMPTPDQLFEQMKDSQFFSTMDMRSGFLNHKIPVECQRHFAFYWNNETWLYTRMCFGHINAPAQYQRVMDSVIREAGLEDNVVSFLVCFIG